MIIRGCDRYGCGYYEASRSYGLHRGVDLVHAPGEQVCSPVFGEVTKLGYPYKDDLSFRYVQVSMHGHDFRLFYVDPCVKVGDIVSFGAVIGTVQDLSKRYGSGMTNHVHFEIMKDGEYINPMPAFLVWDSAE